MRIHVQSSTVVIYAYFKQNAQQNAFKLIHVYAFSVVQEKSQIKNKINMEAGVSAAVIQLSKNSESS